MSDEWTESKSNIIRRRIVELCLTLASKKKLHRFISMISHSFRGRGIVGLGFLDILPKRQIISGVIYPIYKYM